MPRYENIPQIGKPQKVTTKIYRHPYDHTTPLTEEQARQAVKKYYAALIRHDLRREPTPLELYKLVEKYMNNRNNYAEVTQTEIVPLKGDEDLEEDPEITEALEDTRQYADRAYQAQEQRLDKSALDSAYEYTEKVALQRPVDIWVTKKISGDEHLLTGASLDGVIYAGELATFAYQTIEQVREKFPQLRDVEPFYDFTRKGEPSLEGFVAFDPQTNMYIIAFKGTSSWADVGADTNLNLKPWGERGVIASFQGYTLPVPLEGYYGFFRRFKHISGSVLSAAQKVMKKNPGGHAILIVGHSLGGALANIAAFCFGQIWNRAPIQLVTFESPRTFKANTVRDILANPRTEAIEHMAYRIHSKNDPIAAVPLYSMGYRHVGRAYQHQDPKWLNVGWSSVHGTTSVLDGLKRYKALQDNASRAKMLPLTTGRGMKRNRKTSAKGTPEMKERMAYVRSFIKKKMR